MASRIFVSSTCYDLIDARAELETLLRTMGLAPVMSDSPTSEFSQVPDANSINTCLINVDSSDAVLVVLNQRYGTRLGSLGFEDVSATHLEYRRAKSAGKPIYFYIRDRLLADYDLWRKNERNDALQLLWVRHNDYGLFELIDEHKQFLADTQKTSWLVTFANSVELKNIVRKNLRISAAKEEFGELIRSNSTPILSVTLGHGGVTGSKLQLECNIRNVGTHPAFKLSVSVGEPAQPFGSSSESPVLAAGAHISASFPVEPKFGTEQQFVATILYHTSTGFCIKDLYLFHFAMMNSTKLVGGATLQSKEYLIPPDYAPPFIITELEAAAPLPLAGEAP